MSQVPSGFDVVIHAPLRLQICAMLSAVESAAFAALRDDLSVADSVLSKHLSTLRESGYVELRKAPHVSGASTMVAISPSGRLAYEKHIAALQHIVRGAGSAPMGRAN